MGWLTKRLLSIPLEETRVSRRGFHVRDPALAPRLETIGQTFLAGYHAGLDDAGPRGLARELNSIPAELQGFAFEGAGMALTLLDNLFPLNRRRFQGFLETEGSPHVYLLYVGAGWAMARLPWLRWRTSAFLSTLDPLLGWLAMDGYGFHQGYFYWPRFMLRHELPNDLPPYACCAFDQGLGRSLWFVDGADVAQIPVTIAGFSETRHADLWSGVGLACAYAGGVSESHIEALRESAGIYADHLAQGAAFAAAARFRAGNLAAHTELACRVLCGLSAESAACATDAALKNLPVDRGEPAYEIWRHRIRDAMPLRVVR